ncbi:phage protease [Porphyromonas gingivicanis]|uniref:phage protease n=1 Tax=Porphyromonas gingivicanis TaxID=266762 RepID=UPI00046FA4D4|nr:phage protease [Porphyromonas gingivicanis]
MRIIINDESVTNDRGWRLSNAGVDLTRYKNNPVFLHDHETKYLIGRCVNLHVEGSLLVGDIEFDEEDDLAKEVKRKMEKNFLRGISPGFHIEQMGFGEEFDTVEKWELVEISAVTLPSNRAAVKLYSRHGISLNEDEVKEHVAQLKSNFNLNNTMNKQPEQIALSSEAYIALGLDTTAKMVDVSAKVIALSAECVELRQKLQAQEDAERDALISSAVSDGRIKEADRDTYKKLYASDKELCKSVLASMTPATSLSAQVHQSSKGSSHYETLSWDELDKRNMLASLKRANPELFTKKYKERFGTSL